MERLQFKVSGLIRLLVGILVALPATTMATDVSRLEAYATVSKIRNVVISPSGNFVAYQSIENDGNEIIVLDMPSGEIVHIVALKKKDLHSIQFVNDEFVSIVYDPDPSKDHDPHQGSHVMFAISPAGHRTRRIKFFDLKNGTIQKNFIVGAHGDIVGVASDVAAIYFGWGLGSLAEYFVGNGRRTPKYASGSSDTLDWYISKNREPRVREDFDWSKNRHVVYVYRNGEASILLDEHVLSRDINVVALSAEQDNLIYFTRRPDFDRMTYHTMSLSDGSRSEPIFSQYIGRVLTDSGKTAFGFERDEFPAYEYKFLNKKAESLFRSIEKRLPDLHVQLIASTDDFEHMVVRVSKTWSNAYYMFFSAGTPQPVVIGKENSAESSEQSNPRTMLEFSASDGRIIRAYLTTPARASSAGGAPLIILSNGSHEAYQSRMYQWLAQYLASSGFIVVQPGIRGGDYGPTFMPASDLNWGGKIVSDINDTVQHLIDHGITNPARMCIVGVDLGGYAALVAATRSPEKYRCVVSIGGFFELKQTYRRARERTLRYPQYLRYVEALYGISGKDKTSIENQSPLNHVDSDFPPILLMHFKRGDFMLAKAARDMRWALQKKGNNVTIVELPGYDFERSEREAQPAILKAVSGFIQEHL